MKALLLVLLLIPIAVWLINVALNLLVRACHWRRGPHTTPFLTAALVNGIALAVFLPLSFQQQGARAVEVASGLVYLLIYVNSVAFFNWFLFTVTDVSMHVHLLREIGRQAAIRPEVLAQRYNKATILSARIPRLLELGQLRLETGRLVLGGSSVLFGAWVCRCLRRVLDLPLRPQDAHPPDVI